MTPDAPRADAAEGVDPKQAAYEVFAARLGNCTVREEALAKQGFLYGWGASAMMRDPIAAEVIAAARAWRTDGLNPDPDVWTRAVTELGRAVDAYEDAIGGT